MKITKKLAISQKECFDTIMNSVVHDVKEATGKKPLVQKLEGLKFKRKMANGSEAVMIITKCTPPEIYEFQTKTHVNTHTTSYTVTAITEHTCEVVYDETVEAETAMARWNNILVGGLLGFTRKKRITRMLDGIEALVIQQHKDLVTKISK
ncbi:DUF3284 domain-containing protein [Listeria weihenstephanensis]|uniref:DUF3284 domain-containing protein n=1 Tax=Listeria weihenstephanensis TaxID=1006155 RepID=A0A841Z6Z5_9LIST|nr:DUF3284 domain-containing protein [Listeria weihenstephanensis]MBC1500123.1 DUF3284 domain-containing protein [Listeria weihenstephanensis]